MKTTMTPNFVTTQTFNNAMKKIDDRFESIDQRFDAVDKRFDDMELMIKKVDDNSDERFKIFMEVVNDRFKVLMEHPVFSNNRA